jgi:acyl-[acyl-carrier-protein]-phospholipid O-acyltransferase / long-chain-fatty-acid--[acyl-carrier-protein] ligase
MQLPPRRSTLVEWFFRLIGTSVARFLYRVTPFGAEKLPEGGFLLLPNHLTWIDALVLQIACPRPIRFLVYEDFYRNRRLAPLLRLFGTLPLSEKRAKDSLKAAVDFIQRGEIVCIFPEGELSRTGTLLRLKRGYEIIARQAKCPVVPAWMDGLWGSIFSYRGGKFFWKRPRTWMRFPVTVAFGDPLPARQADAVTVRQCFLHLGEFLYSKRPHLRQHLAQACFRGLRKFPGDVAVVDGMDGSMLTRSKLLAAALALAEHLRRTVPEKRIGVVLPSSKGAIVANLGIIFAGKTPVNFNFTAGRAALEASLQKAGVTCCITAGVMKEKLKDFPWPKEVIALEKLVPSLKGAAAKWFLLSKVLPSRWLARLAKIPTEGDRKEAFLLFTSGSSGEPKGVVLSHRNLLANTNQFGEMLDLGRTDVVLGALPFFHSFGSTVCLLFPVVEGVKVVTYPNPLDAPKCAALIEEHRVTLMLATPTFLRGYMKRAEAHQLRSLKLIVTGAEKLPDELANAFCARFGKEVMQGYGLTETSPAASFNLPDPPGVEQPSNRLGSCGRLVPGLAAEIRHPETGEKLKLHDSGMLWFKGANVFEGYLDDPARTAEMISDGWLRTGDLGRFDEDGFLYIEGRISRFSKIGGEMVPHETVEAKIVQALGLNTESERVVAISAVPDQAKGEALVILTTRDIDLPKLRDELADAGLPNLWIPKRALRVEKIPMLASGKLDIQGCRLAAERGLTVPSID